MQIGAIVVQASPTVRRRILASELKRLRNLTGLTQQQAEERAGLGRATLSRYESCVSSMSVPVAEKLFTIYGVEGERLESLVDLTKGARSRGWMKTFGGTIPRRLEDLMALERDASSIHEFGIRVIPGVLQTEHYARAIFRGGIMRTHVEERIQLRMARAVILDRVALAEYWLVLCESALRCLIGGAAVMRQQLEHLVEMAQRPNVTVQILPDAHGAHPAINSPFILLNFDIAPDFSVAYLDYLTGSIYLDSPDEIAQYRQAHRRMIMTALPEEQSLEMIETRIKELA